MRSAQTKHAPKTRSVAPAVKSAAAKVSSSDEDSSDEDTLPRSSSAKPAKLKDSSVPQRRASAAPSKDTKKTVTPAEDSSSDESDEGARKEIPRALSRSSVAPQTKSGPKRTQIPKQLQSTKRLPEAAASSDSSSEDDSSEEEVPRKSCPAPVVKAKAAESTPRKQLGKPQQKPVVSSDSSDESSDEDHDQTPAPSKNVPFNGKASKVGKTVKEEVSDNSDDSDDSTEEEDSPEKVTPIKKADGVAQQRGTTPKKTIAALSKNSARPSESSSEESDESDEDDAVHRQQVASVNGKASKPARKEEQDQDGESETQESRRGTWSRAPALAQPVEQPAWGQLVL